MKFEVGDKVFLKVPPMKSMIKFIKRGKLSSRYIGQFKFRESTGTLAYILSLPLEIEFIHNVFHVS